MAALVPAVPSMGCSQGIVLAVRQDFHRRYSLGSKLGEGSFGQVHVAVKSRSAQEPRAVKVVEIRATGGVDEAKLKAAREEAAVWRKVARHKNCVTLFESFQDQDCFYMVMERCGKSLASKLLDAPRLQHSEVAAMVRDMLRGVSHLHRLRIVHRDLKPPNFLLGGPDGHTLKICDFGLAAVLPKNGGKLYGRCGTPPYMSPELAEGRGYRANTDIWSLGVTAYMMLYGEFPYAPYELDSRKMREAIVRGTPEPRFAAFNGGFGCPVGNPQAHVFVRDLLRREPSRRLTAQQALMLPFVVGVTPVIMVESNSRSLTKARALALLTELLVACSSDEFQRKLAELERRKVARAPGQAFTEYLRRNGILARYGFETSGFGIKELLASVDAMLADPDVCSLWSKIDHVVFRRPYPCIEEKTPHAMAPASSSGCDSPQPENEAVDSPLQPDPVFDVVEVQKSSQPSWPSWPAWPAWRFVMCSPCGTGADDSGTLVVPGPRCPEEWAQSPRFSSRRVYSL